MNLTEVLIKNRNKFGLVLDINYRSEKKVIFDFTKNNEYLKKIDMSNAKQFSLYLNKIKKEKSVKLGIGKYMENRTIYDHSNLFSGQTKRTVHLGVDLWVDAGTKVICPFEGRVHSFKNNVGQGDYGPTIILEHELDKIKFYTLYGHLRLDSLENLSVGKKFNKGDNIGYVGDYPVNGDWPSHLHFEIIENTQGKSGDFPGVCSEDQIEQYKKTCPNPNLILQIKELD